MVERALLTALIAVMIIMALQPIKRLAKEAECEITGVVVCVHDKEEEPDAQEDHLQQR